MTCLFYDRYDAGKQLGARLQTMREVGPTIVLGIPRGGVPVAFEVACTLNSPMDLLFVRKLGVPGCHEVAMGAIASRDVLVLNERVLGKRQISQAAVATAAALERKEIARQAWLYRKNKPEADFREKNVILVDDGLATGASMQAAVVAIRGQHPEHICVAGPVGSTSSCKALRGKVDVLLCLEVPEPFLAVSACYEEFEPTTDHEVLSLMRQAEKLPRFV